MSNFYLKGLSTTPEELKIIKNNFSTQGVDLTTICSKYSEIYMFSKKKIQDYAESFVLKNNEAGTPINLVCHSMGCNLGLLASSKISNLNKLVLISPEFRKPTNEEQDRILVSFPNQENEVNSKMALPEKLKSFILYLRTQGWNDSEITKVIAEKCDISLLYSKGDRFVSQEAIHNLTNKYPKINEYGIDSSRHNPLLTTEGVKAVVKVLKK